MKEGKQHNGHSRLEAIAVQDAEHLRRSSRGLCLCSTMSIITDRSLSLERRKVRYLTHLCGFWPLLTTGTTIVMLSTELRPACSSLRPLVPSKQILVFSIIAQVTYKWFFSTKLQGWLIPNKSSFSSSSDQHQEGLCTSLLWLFSLSGHANHWTSLRSYWRALKNPWSSGKAECWQNFLLP